MKSKTLTKKDLHQGVFFSLGQLRGSIKNGSTERSLALLDKVAADVGEMDIKILRLKRGDLA